MAFATDYFGKDAQFEIGTYNATMVDSSPNWDSPKRVYEIRQVTVHEVIEE